MFKAFSRYRPRILTIVMFLAVAAVLVLVNLTTEISGVEDGNLPLRPYLVKLSSGWPLTWHRYIICLAPVPSLDAIGWYYSASRLACNLPIWLVMLATPVAGCEWMLRRYRPRLRWSLRSMLVVVGLVAAFCGWYAAGRRRASLQDPVIAAAKGPQLWVALERTGPQWLDFLGADPYRRYIVGAKFGDVTWGSGLADEEVLEHLKRLSQLPTLRYLSLVVGSLSPAMTDALKKMQQLRMLSIAHGSVRSDDEQIPRECLAAIGQLTQLEELRLENMVIASGSLKSLENLTRLRSLSFDSCFGSGHWNDEEVVDHPPMFGQLPALPQLEELDLGVDDIDDRDLRQIAALPRLKALHIERYVASTDRSQDISEIRLDKGGEITMPLGDANAFRQALEALWEAKPGIVIDNRNDSADWPAERGLPWDAGSGFMNSRSMLLQLPPRAFPRAIPAKVDDEFRSLKW